MKIVNIIENEKGENVDVVASHGLCFYVETEKHKILVDAGPSDVILENAKALGLEFRRVLFRSALGLDLTLVDTLILTHGHYDHSGGIMAFASINPNAKIYMQEKALRDYYAFDGEGLPYRYIGVDKAIASLPNVVLVNGDMKIDDELFLFVVDTISDLLPSTNKRLLRKEGDVYLKDNFNHEQCLVINCGKKTVLFSGCAHNGILNIIKTFKRKYGGRLSAVVSGFHLMKKSGYTKDDEDEETYIAEKLNIYGTKFFTCHCTGLEPFKVMKRILQSKLEYVYSGDEKRIELVILFTDILIRALSRTLS